MRVELPEGYVPPEPTHPMYGYLTAEEREAFEAQERARLGIVPGVVEEAEVEAEVEEAEEVASSWAPATAEPMSEAEAATVTHTGWVPNPPPEPAGSEPLEPAALGAVGEYRWDAYKQEWVLATDPLPDVAAAAGSRGASSSWTTSDGQRLRWDARAQRWVTEPAEAPS
jgi:hypothetical protein